MNEHMPILVLLPQNIVCVYKRGEKNEKNLAMNEASMYIHTYSIHF